MVISSGTALSSILSAAHIFYEDFKLFNVVVGTLANDVNFQVYLLDGLFRWNEDRRQDGTKHTELLSYDGPLQNSCNSLHAEVFGGNLVDFLPPGRKTGLSIVCFYPVDQLYRAHVFIVSFSPGQNCTRENIEVPQSLFGEYHNDHSFCHPTFPETSAIIWFII